VLFPCLVADETKAEETKQLHRHRIALLNSGIDCSFGGFWHYRRMKLWCFLQQLKEHIREVRKLWQEERAMSKRIDEIGIVAWVNERNEKALSEPKA